MAEITIRCRISKAEKSELPKTRIYRCKTDKKDSYVIFDLLEDLFFAGSGRKLEIDLNTKKPKELDAYAFCGKAKIVEIIDETVIYSIGGYIAKITNYKEILQRKEPPKETYFCIKTV